MLVFDGVFVVLLWRGGDVRCGFVCLGLLFGLLVLFGFRAFVGLVIVFVDILFVYVLLGDVLLVVC